MSRSLRNGIGAALTAVMLLASASGLVPQRGELDLTVEAPASLAPAADRVRRVDRQQLAEALARAGLNIPPQIHVTLIAEDDLRARATPVWIVGLASGHRDIAIFPERIGSYPYDSLESVVWHEVVHLALSAQAGDRPLPRWFHEGVAMSVERGWGVTSQVQLLLAAGGSAGLADLERLFNSETQPETASAYLLAAALVSDLRQRHGAAVPGAIVDRVARGAASRRRSRWKRARRQTRLQLARGRSTDAGRVGFPSSPALFRCGSASWYWRLSPFWQRCANDGGAGGSGIGKSWARGTRCYNRAFACSLRSLPH